MNEIYIIAFSLSKSIGSSTRKDNKIKIFSDISEELLSTLYNGAIATLFPSYHESFGLPIIESMACGTPVITSNIFSMPEIGGNAGIYVNPYDYRDILDKMKLIIVDNKYRKRKSKQSINRAKKFSWKKTAKETYRVYEEVI